MRRDRTLNFAESVDISEFSDRVQYYSSPFFHYHSNLEKNFRSFIISLFVFLFDRITSNHDQQHYGSYQKNATPLSQRRLRNNNDCWDYPSLPSSPNKDKYWSYSNSMPLSTKETPLLNHIYNKKPTKNPSYVNYATSASYSQPQPNATNVGASGSLPNTTYDYHSTQLERYLDEYRRLESKLTRMKETCEKLNREELTERSLMLRNRQYRSRSKLSLVDCPFDSGSFERRYDSRASLHRSFSSKSRSFDRPPTSLERSVSFVPTQKDSFVKPATSDDVIVPKSILKKKGEGYYCAYNPRFYSAMSHPHAKYASNTLPTRRSRLRRFSDSSMDGFYG